ncbi:MAG: hypothetical protein PVJ86_03995 [Phycisphaerales bacterium]
MLFPLILVGVAGGIVTLHIAPWRIVKSLVDDNGDLHRPLAYMIGNSCILAGMYLTEQAGIVQPNTTWWLFLIMAAAGIGALLPRGFAYAVEKVALEGDREDVEAA